MTQNNLGTAYSTLAEVEGKADNCRLAIAAYEQALTVYTHDRLPMQYAGTQNNLGNAYSTLAEVEGKADNCRLAIAAYTSSVTTFERLGSASLAAIARRNLDAVVEACGET